MKINRLIPACLLVLAAFAVFAETPKARSFGKLADGREAQLYTLRSRGGIIAEFSDYGGRLVRLYAPDRHGNLADIACGFNTAAEYERYRMDFMGPLIGRFGNRIRDGRFTVGGKVVELPINEQGNGRHCNLHSGPDGWDVKFWKVRPFSEATAEGLELTAESADGESGFPGRLSCRVVYRIHDSNVWSIDYEVTTDAPTVVNPTHHSFWNLAGGASGSTLSQELKVFADRYSRVDRGLIPVSNDPVEGTGFDFRDFRVLRDMLPAMKKDPALDATGFWYDHNFVLRGQIGTMHPAFVLRDPASGRAMEVTTTEPGLQMYAGQGFDGGLPTKVPGRGLVQFGGIVFETQHFPDSPNHPDYPTTELRPGQVFRSRTEYRFYAE